ncbi:hypothetical protein Pcar_1290 [Syntrophotalea carbinolica DSM 2380]|uniref:FAD-dependent oxidoreductase n=1 Tax=Syntrophotalea carbinolica (strain DSM 2380 / NBRC 103641 / GraBd1) TaxID=338963 RepID=Q3A518_SYNC1|nr:hypothetical protein Pcar_1290 [Syntrophotalea carbinolica DSM 2380]
MPASIQKVIRVKSQHFDVIILGSGLAARIAAFLAGRRGRRILLLSDHSEPLLNPELACGTHLEKLLNLLGQQRQQLRSAGGLQLIDKHHRLDLSAPDLADEWQRELTTPSDAPVKLLQNLDRWGTWLSRALATQTPSALFSLRSQIRLAASGWKSEAGRIPLSRPLAKYLARHVEGEAHTLLRTLFTGLSGLPAAQLTTTQAALLWHWSRLPKAMDSVLFSELLSRRTAQFHVTEIPLDRLDLLHGSGRKLEGILLKDGARIKASQFVIASQSATTFLPAGKKAPRAMQRATRPTWQTTTISENISPLLASRIVLSDATTFLVTRQEVAGGIRYLIEAGNENESHPYTPERLTEHLRTLLPFADFHIEEIHLPQRSRPFADRHVGLSGLPCRPAGRYPITAIPEWMCPGLGSNGEVVLGFALAEQLLLPIRG